MLHAVCQASAPPCLRLNLPPSPRSYIDFLGFMWNMLLVAFAVIIFFTGAYIDHKHSGRFFKKSESGASEVLLHPSWADRVQQSVDSAMHSSGSFAQDIKDLRSSHAGSEKV